MLACWPSGDGIARGGWHERVRRQVPKTVSTGSCLASTARCSAATCRSCRAGRLRSCSAAREPPWQRQAVPVSQRRTRQALARELGRLFECRGSKLCKEDAARKIAERDNINEGWVSVLSALEPCCTFSLRFTTMQPMCTPSDASACTCATTSWIVISGCCTCACRPDSCCKCRSTSTATCGWPAD